MNYANAYTAALETDSAAVWRALAESLMAVKANKRSPRAKCVWPPPVTVVTFADLLGIFFAVHDPTTLNRQGPDRGTQYRSAIFALTDAQEEQARWTIASLEADGVWKGIVTEVTRATRFYPAEGYHQGYFRANPDQGYCTAIVSPKVAKFRAKFRNHLRR